ncbi:MAG: xanthine dehydrogenase family protein molybdopterin-binding subunit, partial [Alphaproteobacteria bacterium]|nr:xanthine dehydrogenase family protein molybdopterin-binding subunit [Alphaproteobacteria bacterium]
MAKFGIGQSVRRVEDDRLITGTGRFLDDINPPGLAYAHFLRSPHAHADVVHIDVSKARSSPGVIDLITGADYRAAGFGNLPCMIPMDNKDGSKRADVPRWPLAVDRVRHVGDPVAAVIAATPAQAKDAAELIRVDYRTLPVIADTARALDAGSARVWEGVPGNLAFHWALGDEKATDNAFTRAEHVTRLDIINNRVVANSMEPRGAVAEKAADGRLVFHVSSQGVHAMKAQLCDNLLKLDRDRLRVMTPDVGGGFGMKFFMYPEYPIVLWATMRTSRPVKWIAERSEGFLSDVQGRDHVVHAELATTREGKFLGLRVRKVANMGAYLSQFAPAIPTWAGAPLLASLYDFPAIHVEVLGVFTNTVPVDAYRGAGRPEANYLVERLVDASARELGIDRAELRRKNFIPPSKMPYKTALLHTYDSGDFDRNMRDAIRLSDWAGFEARRSEARRRGRLRGLGIATYIEATPGVPDHNEAIVTIDGGGQITIFSGEQNNGQGQVTSFAQIVSDHLGVPFEAITIIQGDSDLLANGQGTGGSKAMVIGGSTMVVAADNAVALGKDIAGELLEAAVADLEFAEGSYRVKGTDRRVSLFDVAREAHNRNGVG